jgi:hypothetical protein
MSTLTNDVAPGARRVRHQAREAVALMAFSAVTSVVLATAFLVLTSLSDRV